MKLFKFWQNDMIRTGLVLDGKHIDLEAAVDDSGKLLPATLEEIIESGLAPAALEAAYRRLPAPVLEEGEITFAPAVTDPEKILCVGLNYQAHQKETNMLNDAKFPPLFCKFRNSLNSHEGVITLPACAEQFDYEVELVAVIGKEASRVTPEEAAACVFGYTVGNDFSARDLQTATSQWLMGKACDGFAPIGPYIVTADELDPAALHLCTRVNGQTMQDGNTSDMIFSVAQIVSHISQVMTLVPGDVIYTGTPSGVILGRPENERRWLKAGDTVEVEIEGIGVLRNTLA